jgi:hypothetical protein
MLLCMGTPTLWTGEIIKRLENKPFEYSRLSREEVQNVTRAGNIYFKYSKYLWLYMNQCISASWNSGSFALVGIDGHEFGSCYDQIAMILSLFLFYYAHSKIFNFLIFFICKINACFLGVKHICKNPYSWSPVKQFYWGMIQALSKACVFLLSENMQKLLCMGRTYTANRGYNLKSETNSFNIRGYREKWCKVLAAQVLFTL